MPITLNCPKCRKHFRVRDESIGRKVRCPRCLAVLQVPERLFTPSTAELDLGASRPLPATVAPAHSDEPVAETGVPVSYADLTVDPGPSELVETAPPSAPAASVKPAPAPAPDRRNSAKTERPARRVRTMIESEPETIGDVGDLASGLRLVKAGVVFLLVPFLAYLGEVVYFMLSTAPQVKDHGFFLLLPVLDSSETGQLGMQNVSLWHEIRLLYVVLPLLFFFFLVIPGRMRCLRAPAVTQSRGLACASLCMTILALFAVGLYVVCEVLKLQGTPYPDLQWSGGMAAIATILLAEMWFCMFLAQIGWPLAAPKLPREVAGFAAMIILVTVALLIANHFKQLFIGFEDLATQWDDAVRPKFRKVDLGPIQDERTERLLLGAGALFASAVLIVFHYSGLIGSARRAVRRHDTDVDEL